MMSSELLWWLHLNPYWALGYVDDVAAVYFRQDRNEAWLRGRSLDAADLFPPFPERVGPTDLVRRMGRTNFYMAVRRPQQALPEFVDEHRFPDGAVWRDRSPARKGAAFEATADQGR